MLGVSNCLRESQRIISLRMIRMMRDFFIYQATSFLVYIDRSLKNVEKMMRFLG